MTVKDLIAKLGHLEGDAIVLTYDECWLTDVVQVEETRATYVKDPAGDFWRTVSETQAKRFTKNPPCRAVILS